MTVKKTPHIPMKKLLSGKNTPGNSFPSGGYFTQAETLHKFDDIINIGLHYAPGGGLFSRHASAEIYGLRRR